MGNYNKQKDRSSWELIFLGKCVFREPLLKQQETSHPHLIRCPSLFCNLRLKGRLCFQLKYLHPHKYKPGLYMYVTARKFGVNHKLESGQILLSVLNRSKHDCSYKFCPRCLAQWTGQGFNKCVCQSLLQGQSKVELAQLQSHTP